MNHLEQYYHIILAMPDLVLYLNTKMTIHLFQILFVHIQHSQDGDEDCEVNFDYQILLPACVFHVLHFLKVFC
jgi:hypothetical protein